MSKKKTILGKNKKIVSNKKNFYKEGYFDPRENTLPKDTGRAHPIGEGRSLRSSGSCTRNRWPGGYSR